MSKGLTLGYSMGAAFDPQHDECMEGVNGERCGEFWEGEIERPYTHARLTWMCRDMEEALEAGGLKVEVLPKPEGEKKRAKGETHADKKRKTRAERTKVESPEEELERLMKKTGVEATDKVADRISELKQLLDSSKK